MFDDAVSRNRRTPQRPAVLASRRTQSKERVAAGAHPSYSSSHPGVSSAEESTRGQHPKRHNAQSGMPGSAPLFSSRDAGPRQASLTGNERHWPSLGATGTTLFLLLANSCRSRLLSTWPRGRRLFFLSFRFGFFRWGRQQGPVAHCSACVCAGWSACFPPTAVPAPQLVSITRTGLRAPSTKR